MRLPIILLMLMKIILPIFGQEGVKPWIAAPPPPAQPRPSPEETINLNFNTLFHFLENPSDDKPPQRMAGITIRNCKVSGAVRFAKNSVYELNLWERATGATISGFDKRGISALTHNENVAQEIIKRAELSRQADARVYYTLWIIDEAGKKQGYAMIVDYVEWVDRNGKVVDHTDQGQRPF